MRAHLNRLTLGIVLSIAALAGARLHGSSTTWDLADVFVAVANGAYQIRDSTGALKDSSLTLVTSGGTSRGCALDSSLNLYTVNATDNKVRKYLFGTQQPAQTISTTTSSPQSIVFDAADNFYVAYAGGTIEKFNAAGGSQGTRTVTVDSTSAISIDLAADLKTIFYTSGGQTVRTVDFVSGATSLFATFPPPNGPTYKSYALRLLRPTPADGPNALIGGVLVAHGADIRLLSSTGAPAGTYDATGQDAWFALALTPNDIHPSDRAFWAGDLLTGKLWRFKVNGTGTPIAPELGPIAASSTIGGLCVNGEPTQGKYTQIVSLSPSNLSGAATFNQGNPTQQHQVGVSFASLSSPLRIAISAREVVSDGQCNNLNDTTDVDCGFTSFFSTDPALPQGIAYVHGRALYYWSESLRPVNFATEVRTVTLTSVHPSADILGPQAGSCGVDSNGQPVRRAARLFHDPTDIPEFDQFDSDFTLSFFVDEWGESGSPNSDSRYMAAFRCANGVSIISRPPDGRTFSAGSSVPIEVDLFDKQGNPITDANTDPHRIVVTIGFSGQVLNTVNTPGSSFNAFKQVQPGIYRVNLDTTGLLPSTLPYYACINDATATPVPLELPKYMNQCVSFFLK